MFTSWTSLRFRLIPKSSAGVFVLCLFAFLLVAAASAKAAVPSYEVKGLQRTSAVFFDYIVHFCGEKGAIQSDSLRQCIYDFRIFSEVDVQKRSDGIFSVKVEERWTLLPMPMVYVSDDIRRYGVFVFESNFLGRGKILGGGLTASNGGQTYMLLYRDPAVDYSPVTLTLRSGFDSQNVYAFAGNIKAYGYKEDRQAISIAPGLQLNPYWAVSIEAEWMLKRLSDAGYGSVPNDYDTVDSGVRLQFKDTAYRLFFNEGLSAEFRLKQQIYKSDEEPKTFNFEALLSWEKGVFANQVFQLSGRAAALYGDDSRDLIRAGYLRGYRGIEANGLWLRKTLAFAFDYQIPVLTSSSGVWTVAPFVDLGWFTSTIDTSREAYQSFGVGTYYFIKRIALPGIGLIVGHNADYKGDFVAFSLGMALR